MIFLVGGKGLVGSGFSKFFKENKILYKIITRQNKKNFYNKSCDILIDCNGNGSKRIGIADPLFDFKASVYSVFENLVHIKYNKYVYISSSQTYEDTKSKKMTKENRICNNLKLNNYGFNKLIAENYVKKFSSKYLIVRLPYIVGPGLKRNPVYDLSHNKETYVTLNSNINFIHTSSIAKITYGLIKKNKFNQTYNLGAKNNIKVRDILNLCGLKESELKKTSKKNDVMFFNCNKISQLVKLPTSINEVKKYLSEVKRKKND